MFEYFIGPLGVIGVAGLTWLAYSNPLHYQRLIPYIFGVSFFVMFSGLFYVLGFTNGKYSGDQAEPFPFSSGVAAISATVLIFYLFVLTALPQILGDHKKPDEGDDKQ